MIRCGTPAYCAPEIMRNGDNLVYTCNVDIYSIGCIVYYILTGTHYFLAEKAYYRTRQPIYETFDLSEASVRLLKRLLNKDPNYRPTSSEALSDPWFNDYQEAVHSSMAINRHIIHSRRNLTSKKFIIQY